MSSKRLKLLLIRGLGHSGTTMLDLALGAHPQIIGLGEAARILATPKPGDEHRGPSQLRGALRFERRCTCGSLQRNAPSGALSLSGFSCMTKGHCRRNCSGC